jgi:hypothetical protein
MIRVSTEHFRIGEILGDVFCIPYEDIFFNSMGIVKVKTVVKMIGIREAQYNQRSNCKKNELFVTCIHIIGRVITAATANEAILSHKQCRLFTIWLRRPEATTLLGKR